MYISPVTPKFPSLILCFGASSSRGHFFIGKLQLIATPFLTMTNLDTAEGTTRFLRSKDVALGDITATAAKLIGGEIDVYLPNKNLFVFDLLCDRLNDTTKAFKTWKYNDRVWQLFVQLWRLLAEDDRAARTKLFRKVKFVEVIDTVFGSLTEHTSYTISLMRAIFSTVDAVLQDGFIEVDESSAVGLFTSYVKTVPALIATEGFEDYAAVNAWTASIASIYFIPKLRVNYKLNKKNITKYITECLPHALNLLSSTSEKEELLPTRNIATKMNSDVLFNEETRANLKLNVDALFSTKYEVLTDSYVCLFFEQIIEGLSLLDIALCEEVFLLITKTKKFDHLSEQLLQILTKVNRSLSTKFFKEILDLHIKEKSPNWKLVGYLIELDALLALEEYQVILKKLKLGDEKTKFRIGDILADAFIRAREADLLFKTVWPSAIEIDRSWKSSEFSKTISSKINELSVTQVTGFLKHFLEQDFQSVSTFMIAIVRGLINCNIAKQESVKDIILDNCDRFFVGESAAEMWFFILCLYEDAALEIHKKDLVKYLKKNKDTIFSYYCIFRILELTDGEELKIEFKDGLLGFVQSSNQKNTILPILFSRWVVILNHFFDKAQIESLVGLAVTHLPLEQLLTLFSSNSDYLFEQPNVTAALGTFFLSNVKELPKDNQILLFKLITAVPVQCLDRITRTTLLDTICERFISSQEAALNVSTRTVIRHILHLPPYRSKLEKDYELLLDLFRTSLPEAEGLTKEITKLIWSNHLKTHTSEGDKTFIASCFKYLNKFFKGFKARKSLAEVSPEFEMAAVILVESHTVSVDEEFSESLSLLSASFINSCMGLLKLSAKQNHETVEWLADTLQSLLNHESKFASDVQVLVKQVSLEAKVTPSMAISANLFALLAKVSVCEFGAAQFLTSLYIALSGTNKNLSIVESLGDYFNRLSETDFDTFQRVFVQVLLTLRTDADASNIGVLVPLVNMLVKCLQKEKSKESSKLLSGTISAYLTYFDMIVSSEDSLVEVLKTLESALSVKIWCFTQYTIELTVAFTNKCAALFERSDSATAVAEYVSVCKVFSHIILFHRFRLTSRHHIIMSALSSLLKPLSLKWQKSKKENYLAHSTVAAAALSRLLVNLCEPSANSKELAQKSLTTSSSLIKKSLRKHIHIVLINYISLQLAHNFMSDVNAELVPGIFSIFNLLSKTELQLVSLSLDIQGKTYFKTLYNNYKSHGKWKDS